MTYRGDFDPSLFDQDDAGTWPTIPAGGYRAGDWFYVTGPGTVNGDHVDVGFRVFPMATGRRYGHLDYGDAVYGGPVPAEPWPADPDVVWWRGQRWSDAPAWQRPPAPYDGAPFGDTGWRISVALWTPDPAARRYGDWQYGDGLYGDTLVPASDWFDTACPVVAVVVRRGGTDSTPLVDVDQISVELADHDASLFPLNTRGSVDVARGARVATPVRVALIDPAGDPWPIGTGRIERITDRHDTPTRTVVIDAVGMAVDMVRETPLQRPSEDVGDRLARLFGLAAYSWGIDPYSGPSQTLRRIDYDPAAQLREQLDLTALSAAHSVATDPTGVIRFDPWPPVPRSSGVAVVDQLGAAALPVVDADVVGDRDELLNLVTVQSAEVQGAEAITVTRHDPASVGQFGPSDATIGFPLTGLSAQVADLETLADATLARFGLIVNRVTRVAVDTWHDARWLSVLARLQIGDTINVDLTKPVRRHYTAVVVGSELRIDPGRVRADLYLSTTDPTT